MSDETLYAALVALVVMAALFLTFMVGYTAGWWA